MQLKKKTEIGGFYLTTKDDEQEYNYEVRFIDNKLIIKVDDFEGTPDELLNPFFNLFFCMLYKWSSPIIATSIIKGNEQLSFFILSI